MQYSLVYPFACKYLHYVYTQVYANVYILTCIHLPSNSAVFRLVIPKPKTATGCHEIWNVIHIFQSLAVEQLPSTFATTLLGGNVEFDFKMMVNIFVNIYLRVFLVMQTSGQEFPSHVFFETV